MSDERTTWTIETVPDSFWRRIEEAHGDTSRFRDLLKDVPQQELQDMYWQYIDLAERLFTNEHLSHLESTSDDAVMDLQNWIVQQGRDYYLDILHHPEKTPPTVPQRAPGFHSAIIREHRKRFGTNIR